MKQERLIKLTAEQKHDRLEAFARNEREIRYLRADLKKQAKEARDRIRDLTQENDGILLEIGPEE